MWSHCFWSGSSLKDSLEKTSQKAWYGLGIRSSSCAGCEPSFATSASHVEIVDAALTCSLLAWPDGLLPVRQIPCSVVLQDSGQHVILTLPVCQFISGLCLTNQGCPKMMALCPMLET